MPDPRTESGLPPYADVSHLRTPPHPDSPDGLDRWPRWYPAPTGDRWEVLDRTGAADFYPLHRSYAGAAEMADRLNASDPA